MRQGLALWRGSGLAYLCGFSPVNHPETALAETLVCWKCGADLRAVRQPFSRRAVCPACEAELHICRMCTLYNPQISDRCNEPKAEHPREVERANFCDYYKPRANAYRAKDSARSQTAKANVDALFGGAPAEEPSAAREKLDDLFRGKK